MRVLVNNLEMRPATSAGNGNNRMLYVIMGRLADMQRVRFPPARTMKRLARDYLGCEIELDPRGNDGQFYFFTINGGVKLEKRAAFLAAVIAKSSTI